MRLLFYDYHKFVDFSKELKEKSEEEDIIELAEKYRRLLQNKRKSSINQ